MRKAGIGTLVMVLGLVSGGAFAAHEITADSTVARATVYGDRAEVTRAATVQLVPGEHEVRFEPLPASLVPDSVRVSGEGTAKVTIGGVEIDRSWHPERQAGRAKELEEKIESLDDEMKEINARKTVIQQQERFISTVEQYSASNLSKSLAVSSETTLDPSEIVGFVGTQRVALSELILELETRERAINRELEALRNKLAHVADARGNESIAAVVDVDAETAGNLALELTYVVPDAFWRPIYDARLADNQKSVELGYNAVVVQKTGEDWLDVGLRLSTAQPQIGARIPELAPLQLALATPQVRRARAAGRVVAGQAAPPPAPPTREYFLDGEMDELKALGYLDQKAKVRVAAVESKGISVLFTVPGKEDIPSDGNEHKTAVSTAKFKVEPKHIAVPKLSPHVFLECEILNESDLPLLPGKVNTFVSGNFVGASTIDAVAPEEEFELGFGVDAAVKVEREELRDVRGKSGILKGKRRVTRGYEFTVNNNRKENVSITIVDQIPVSHDEDVKVSITEASIEPAEKNEDGILEWKLSLKPREEKKFQFEYQVEYPKSKHVSGLE